MDRNERNTTVSYTHLDVYKRQKEYSLDRNGQIKHKEKMEADDYEVYAKLKEEIENGVKKLNEMYSNIYERCV